MELGKRISVSTIVGGCDEEKELKSVKLSLLNSLYMDVLQSFNKVEAEVGSHRSVVKWRVFSAIKRREKSVS